MRTGQVQVLRGAGAQVVQELAPIGAHHLRRRAGRSSIEVEQGHDDRAVQVLVAGLAQDADALQRAAQHRAGLVLLGREPIGQRPVRIP